MIDEQMRTAINKQINAELYSAYLYLSMATYFEDQALPGFANWMYVQNQEETFHAMKFLHFLVSRGGRVELMAIDEPPRDWSSPLAVFEHVYRHEQHVTSLIGDLVNLAGDIKDRATFNELQWFVAEQVEEEANAEAIVGKLRLAKDAPAALFMINQELAARVYTPPAATA